MTAEDLRDIQNLDALLKDWFNRAELFDMQAQPLEREAVTLGVGELTVYRSTDHSGHFLQASALDGHLRSARLNSIGCAGVFRRHNVPAQT